MWAMAEAMESPYRRQRARWYEYCSRLSSSDPEAEGPVNLRIIQDADEVMDEEDSDEEMMKKRRATTEGCRLSHMRMHKEEGYRGGGGDHHSSCSGRHESSD